MQAHACDRVLRDRAGFAAALAAGRVETEIRAEAVRYVADRDAIEVMTTCHAGFLIPRRWIGALRGVPIKELTQLEIWPDGSAIELGGRDIHITCSVDGLMAAILPAMLPTQTIATIFASRGGRVTSEAKRIRARENGCKDDRPRKTAKILSAAGM